MKVIPKMHRPHHFTFSL